MGANINQLLLLLITIGVPLVLFGIGRSRLVLGWVCITLFVQVFDTTFVTNLVAARVVGLLYLPTTLLTLGSWLRLTPVKAWILNYLYLILLAIAFGYLWPWPDVTGIRPFTQLPEGRSLIYMVRLLSDFSLAVFVANELRKPGTLGFVAKALMIGTTTTALAGLVSFVSQIDLYALITGFKDERLLIDRPRGLSYEPRGLGLACVYGIVILLIRNQRLNRGWFALLFVNVAGLLVAASTSALVTLAVGLAGGWFLVKQVRQTVAQLALLGAMLLVIGVMVFPDRFEAAITNINDRIDPTARLMGTEPQDLREAIAYRLDVFDASALLFLLDQPQHLLIGTGPGLVSLPASEYVPPGTYSAIYGGVGINTLPTHAPLLELSNSGLFGLVLWLVQIFSCLAALRLLAAGKVETEQAGEWQFARAFFITGTLLSVVQSGISPIWSVLLAIGWTASHLVSEHRQSTVQAAKLQAIATHRGTLQPDTLTSQ